jgi:hypothetical protein
MQAHGVIALGLDLRDADPFNAEPANAERVPAALIIQYATASIPPSYIIKAACT